MIKFQHLIVEHYKSIEYASLDFTPGVFKVVGQTINGSYTSNGAGKSTVLQALTLVLYNKDFQGAPIESVSNRYTGKPFKITLNLHVDRDGKANDYVIINDRSNKNIRVLRNNRVLSDRTSKSLKIILDLLGMSENTFKFTHYITTNSILELTRNISNATLFNEVLQVAQLKVMGQDLMLVKKNLQASRDELYTAFNDLNNARKLLKVTNDYNVADIEDELLAVNSEIRRFQTLYDDKVLPLEETLNELLNEQRELRSSLRQKKQSSTSGVCSMCGSVVDPQLLVDLLSDIERISSELVVISEEMQSMESKVSRISSAFTIETSELKDKALQLNKDLSTGEQLAEIHKELLTGTSSFSEDEFKAVSKELNVTKGLLNDIDKMRDAIRSGAIFEDIMNDFFTLVNVNIQKYRKVINLTSFDVETTSFKSGMVVILRIDGYEIPVESLSNGEKARLSLLVLVAVLEAMQQTAQSNSNFISFDEATSSFDESGIEELKNLFAHMKNLEQSCFVITHGSELHKVAYDGTLTMLKDGDTTTSTFIKD